MYMHTRLQHEQEDSNVLRMAADVEQQRTEQLAYLIFLQPPEVQLFEQQMNQHLFECVNTKVGQNLSGVYKKK